jgi:hypothetical protein
LTYSNVTIDRQPLRTLTDCETYIAANVPENVTYFNTTIDIPPISNNLTVYTGAMEIIQSGNMTISSNVDANLTSLNYTLRFLTLANSSIYYVNVEDFRIFYSVNNGTNSLIFDYWNPSVFVNDTYGGYIGIYDLERFKVQSATQVIALDTERFEGSGIVLIDPAGNLTSGSVIGLTRALQL